MTIVNEQQRDQQSSPAFRTLEQKIDELTNGIRGIQDIFLDRKKIILQQLKEIVIQQLHEIRQLAQDLNIDNIQSEK